MTPDGISTTDWERVKELACKVANASGANDEGLSSEYTNQLLLLLDELQRNKMGSGLELSVSTGIAE